MAAYSRLQQAEFASEKHGYSATRHQRFVGTGYFDEIANVLSNGMSSTTALSGSTEEEQFEEASAKANGHAKKRQYPIVVDRLEEMAISYDI